MPSFSSCYLKPILIIRFILALRETKMDKNCIIIFSTSITYQRTKLQHPELYQQQRLMLSSTSVPSWNYICPEIE
jgi:hypothetical protein